MGNETVDFFRAAWDMLAFIGAIHVELFGAQIYVADLVGIAMVRLMAVIMTGIVMAGFGEFYPSEISGGMQRRAGIARAMALDPEILFFDDVGLRALLTTQSIITGQLMIELDFYPNTPRQICVIDGMSLSQLLEP